MVVGPGGAPTLPQPSRPAEGTPAPYGDLPDLADLREVRELPELRELQDPRQIFCIRSLPPYPSPPYKL